LRPQNNKYNWIYRLEVMENLEENKTYLLKFGQQDGLYAVTILKSTETAYYVRWDNGLNGNYKWEEKKVFCKQYSVLEDITEITDITKHI